MRIIIILIIIILIIIYNNNNDNNNESDNFDSVTMMKQLLPFEFASNISIKLNFPLLSFHSPPCTQVLLPWSLLEPSLEECTEGLERIHVADVLRLMEWFHGVPGIPPFRNSTTVNRPWWIIADRAHVNDLASLSDTDRRLAAYGGSSFEPILQAFHQEDFIALVHQSLDNWKAIN